MGISICGVQPVLCLEEFRFRNEFVAEVECIWGVNIAARSHVGCIRGSQGLKTSALIYEIQNEK
jgi:hypothetical protein